MKQKAATTRIKLPIQYCIFNFIVGVYLVVILKICFSTQYQPTEPRPMRKKSVMKLLYTVDVFWEKGSINFAHADVVLQSGTAELRKDTEVCEKS